MILVNFFLIRDYTVRKKILAMSFFHTFENSVVLKCHFITLLLALTQCNGVKQFINLHFNSHAACMVHQCHSSQKQAGSLCWFCLFYWKPAVAGFLRVSGFLSLTDYTRKATRRAPDGLPQPHHTIWYTLVFHKKHSLEIRDEPSISCSPHCTVLGHNDTK